MKTRDNYGKSSSDDEAGLDLRGLIADFRRYSLLFGVVFCTAFVLILFPLLSQTPKFVASSAVMIDPRSVNITSASEQVLSDLPQDAATIDTEVALIKSASLAEMAIRELELDKDPEFNPFLSPRKKYFGLVTEPQRPEAALTPLEKKARQQIITNIVLGGLTVRREGTTRVINISYSSTSPEKAMRIADEWANFYLAQQMEARFEATRSASGWLDSRLDELRGQVEAAERAVQQYKIANNLMSSEGATLTEQEISSLNQQLAVVRVDQAESEARLATARRQLAAGSTGEDVGEALNSGVVANLRSQSAEVSRRVAELEARYGPLHPEIIKAKREKADIDQQIRNEIARIISNLEAQVQVQRQRTASLAGSVGSARGVLAGNNRAQVRLNELERDAQAVRSLYESYLERFKETSSQEGMAKSDARIVAKAKLPTGPSSPKVSLSVALALVGAFGAGAAAVLGRRAFDSVLTTSTDVERHLRQPYLAGLPDLNSTVEKGYKRTDPVTYVTEKPLSVFAEGFRSLRASLLYTRSGDQARVIALTSCLPGEGKTTASMCLAQIVALAGQSVVVVDCDLRRKSINAYVQDQPEAGILEVLDGSATLDQALTDGPAGKVKILPVKPESYTTRDVFGDPSMDTLLSDLKERFDVIIMDTAPVLPVVDTRILVRKADAVVMLVQWRKTPRDAAQKALDLLLSAEAPMAGVALSQIDVNQQAKYAYGDSGFYYKAYKGYYTE